MLTRLFLPTHRIVKNHRNQESDFTPHFTHWSPLTHRKCICWALGTHTVSCLLHKGRLYVPTQTRDGQAWPGSGFTKETRSSSGLAPCFKVSRWGLWTAAGFLEAKRIQIKVARIHLNNHFFPWSPVGQSRENRAQTAWEATVLGPPLELHPARWPGLAQVCFWVYSRRFRGNTTEAKIFFFRKLE